MVDKNTSSHLDVLTQKNIIIFTSTLGVLFLGGLIIFGWNVLLIGAVSYLVAFIVEFSFAKVRKRPLDKTWYVTPLVFALLMPPTASWWVVMIGSFFGVFFGKAVFGGTGKYIFNPAVVGVLFLVVSFPNEMLTKWLNPQTGQIITRTAIQDLKIGMFNYKFTDLLLGNVAGAVGETIAIAIILLGIFLIALRIIDFRIPLAYIGTVFAFTFIGNILDPNTFKDPYLSIFAGSLLFGAFFLATDPVTAPIRPWGRIIYGVGLGILTVIIRVFSAYPEGVIFAVIIMNAFSGLIDNFNNQDESKVNEVTS